MVKKRVNVVSIKLVKESSFLYEPRKITSPNDGVELVKRFLKDLDREEFLVVSLDTKNQPNSVNICSRGTVNASIVHPREVFKTAILSNASAILIAHNHPSGLPEPSEEDIAITKRLSQASEILGIKILDHIIIGEELYYSFKEHEKI